MPAWEKARQETTRSYQGCTSVWYAGVAAGFPLESRRADNGAPDFRRAKLQRRTGSAARYRSCGRYKDWGANPMVSPFEASSARYTNSPKLAARD